MRGFLEARQHAQEGAMARSLEVGEVLDWFQARDGWGVSHASCVSSGVDGAVQRAETGERSLRRQRASVGPVGRVGPNERYAARENDNGGRSVRCPVCGAERVCRGRRWKRVYCSAACRARAWRRRRVTGEEAA